MKKQSSLRAQRTISKQAEFDEEEPNINISSSSDSSSIKETEQKISIANDSDNTITTENEHAKQTLVNSCHGAMVTGAQRNRTNNKLKLLVRSQAIRESTSPPRDPASCSPRRQASPVMVHNVATSLELTINNNNIKNNNIVISPVIFDSKHDAATTDDTTYEVVTSTTTTYRSSAHTMQESVQCKTPHDVVDDDQQVVDECYDENVDEESTIDHDHDVNTSSSMVKYRNNASPISNNNNNYNNNHTSTTNNNNNRISTLKISTNNRQNLEISTITISCQNCTAAANAPCCCAANENNNNNVNNFNNTLTVSSVSSNRVTNNNNTCNKSKLLKHQNSSSFDSALAPSPSLSRDSSTEQYTDTTGINLGQFILETLNRNTKDRMLLLRIEQELVSLAKDKSKTHYKFPPMSSYQRMLVHRCAAFFGMDHNIEASGKCVIVNKTRNTRLPDIKFRDHIRDDLLFPEEPRRSILKRDSNSFEESCFKSPDRQLLSMENRRSKSFEEREEEYEKVRRRIFNREQMHDCSSQEELGWADIPWCSSDSDNSTRMRLLPPDHQTYRPTRLLKGQSVETRDTLRPCVSKSFSFGGYTGSVSLLSRGDSVTSTHSAGARLLTKQDSAASSSMSWRLSPSSSGYKSQSQRSDSVTPSPTATPYPSTNLNSSVDDNTNPPSISMSWDESNSPQNQPPCSVQHDSPVMPPEYSNGNAINNNQQIVWTSYQNQQQSQNQMIWTANHASPPQEVQDTAVTANPTSADMTQTPIMWAITDLNQVPKGSFIINAETGTPYKNTDGTDYAFDPNNLHPSLVTLANSVQTSMMQQNFEQSQIHYNGAKTNISTQKVNTAKQTFHKSSTKPVNNQTQGPVKPNYAPPPTNKQSSSPNKPNAHQGNGKSVAKSVSPTKQSGVGLTNNNNTKPENGVGATSPRKMAKYQQKMNNSLATRPPASKAGFTNTATSPSLPFTPPMQAQYNAAAQTGSYQYMTNSQYENMSNLPIQSFPMNYSNVPLGTFGSSTMVPIQNAAGAMQLYSEESTPVYNYSVPQYNRMDSSVSELSGYFMNMGLNNDVAATPTNNAQPITYQSPNAYWGPQQMVCYVPPQANPNNQRYPVPLVQGQSGGYIQTYVQPQSSGPTTYSSAVTPANAMPPSNSELVPIYPTGPPPSLVYGHPPPVASSSTNLTLTNHPPPTHPSIVYAPTNPPPPSNAIMYTPTAPPPQMYATPNIVYTSTSAAANPNTYPSTNTPVSNNAFPNSVYNSKQSAGSDKATFNRPQTKFNSFNKNVTRNTPSNHSNITTHSNPSSSGSSNSPASTVVQNYYHNNAATGNGAQFNRHCSPSDTPPSNVAYGYPHQFQQNYGPMPPPPHLLSHQSTMIFRNNFQMGIRASPSINARTSRSPTPGVDYERNNRYTMPPPVYTSVPCIIPGDMRFMSPRQQAPPPYRNAYNRPSTFPQNANDAANLGRHSKVKKPRTKPTPPLPPSGR